MERKNKLIIILSILIISAIFFYNKPLEVETIESEFILGENMGFDLTPGRLNFGKISPNNSASREIVIENNFDKTIKVKIKSEGEISKNIIVSENNFLVKPSQSKNITFTAYTQGLIEFKTYKGKITIISKRYK
jgi:hypothetical protein